MVHDTTKVLLGVTGSNDRVVTCEDDDPATFLAGLAVRKQSDGTLSLSSGSLMGISLGASLSNHLKTAVCRIGNDVPLKLTDYGVKATGIITISSYANLVSGTDDAITVNGVVFTAQAGAATLGEATFQAVTDNNTTAASLVAQINAHPTVGLVVVATRVNAAVTLTYVDYGVAGNDITLTYTDNDTNVGAVLSGLSGGKLSGGVEHYSHYAYPGAPVRVNSSTGVAVSSSGTLTGAFYTSGAKLGLLEDGTEAGYFALVDMGGGL